ncbi:cupin domain-containing protein [Ciceribacter naphthalenivorans]|uniref:Cupin n=3 Tax=Alphaproteobacteria TaxID=28211 RepID=A0A512HE22_9HYPH|nr:cupin domain-containing protein [Ciceribacter naphthalenivorans]GEO83694.1 cupin [Ciceribacter naphthalenivorans]GLR24154.1 cupin [Ciceribacter naphthalenivorans]GLT07010.1 cupin [Sphingomonas psychrolutea]
MPIKLMFAAVALVAMARREAPATKPALVVGHKEKLDLKPAPINPAWVIQGQPWARAANHSEADDRAAATAVWDCTAGEFRWFFRWDETVVIEEGSVLVTAEDGTQRLLTKGDIAYFRGGTWATWRIDNYVRKIAFFRRPLPSPLAFAYRAGNALRRRSLGLRLHWGRLSQN